MADLQIFQNADFGSVRTIEQDGKVLFCGRDIAEALGYQRPADAITAHCKGVCVLPTPSNGGIQRMKFITEGDVYRLITHSRLPAAEQFERWVFDEVLPTIRCTGGYSLPRKQIDNLQALQRSLKKWRELEEEFTELTTEARQRYERNRATRDECRAEVLKLEHLIDHAILCLGTAE